MPLRTCKKGLHQYDTETAPKIGRKRNPTCPNCLRVATARYLSSENGRSTCPECRRASLARYKRSERGRAVAARYFHSEKGQAAEARYLRKRKQRAGDSSAE